MSTKTLRFIASNRDPDDERDFFVNPLHHGMTETSQSFQVEILGELESARASGGALTSSPPKDKEIVNIRLTTQTMDFKGTVGAAAQLGFKAGVMKV